MGKSKLSQIECGEIALDSISEIVALANALQVAPSELMRLPVPAPANGTDCAVEAVRGALMVIGRNRPGGQVVSAGRAAGQGHGDARCALQLSAGQ